MQGQDVSRLRLDGQFRSAKEPLAERARDLDDRVQVFTGFIALPERTAMANREEGAFDFYFDTPSKEADGAKMIYEGTGLGRTQIVGKRRPTPSRKPRR